MSIALLFCEPGRGGYFPVMPKKSRGQTPEKAVKKSTRRPLTQEELSDQRRLNVWYETWKAAEPGRTQATLAERLGWAGQSAVSAYMSQNTPLNIDATIKFADEFGCTPADISPRISAQIMALVDRFAYWPFPKISVNRVRRLDERDLAFLEGILLPRLEDIETERQGRLSGTSGESPGSPGKARRANGK